MDLSLQSLVRKALEEDGAHFDATTIATVPEGATAQACIRARSAGVLSGIEAAELAFSFCDPRIHCAWLRASGERIRSGDRVATITGPLHAILRAERVALNLLQRASGIATLTRRYVEAVAGTGCAIADTRKTTPLWRALEKRAVRDGGGVNHRASLREAILIKENHIAAAGGVRAAIVACRQRFARLWIEVECETLAEVKEAVLAAPDAILLDNMSPQEVRQARGIVPKHILLEASGGITLANARCYAECGVDRLAIGAITHSAPALDLSLRVEKVW